MASLNRAEATFQEFGGQVMLAMLPIPADDAGDVGAFYSPFVLGHMLVTSHYFTTYFLGIVTKRTHI